MIAILGWIIWSLSTLLAFSLIYGTIRSLRMKQSVSKATVYQGMFLTIALVVLLLVPSFSKLNLLWILPVGFFLILHFVIHKAVK